MREGTHEGLATALSRRATALVGTLRRTGTAVERIDGARTGSGVRMTFPQTPVAPWASPIEELMTRLATGSGGLASAEAARRLDLLGPNRVDAVRGRTRLEILAAQLANLPTSLLLGSSAVSTLLRDFLDAGAILSVVGINSALGYRIERKSEEILASWRRLEAGQAEVLRGGALVAIAATDLVPGDVLLCRAGDTLPADARLIDAHRLACDEAVLTGESEPQTKGVAAVRRSSPLAERRSMLYAGTKVVSGHGRAVVTATARATEVAAVRRLIEEQETPKTPLERQLAEVGRAAAASGVGAGIVSAAARWISGQRVADVMRGGVALAVAAIPEGLPVVATAALVRSMERLRERGMVVRRLASAETLGAVTVVCADKTGTLTRNDMTLEVIDCGDGPIDPRRVRGQPERLFRHGPTLALAAAVLNSDVDAHRRGDAIEISGSSTERALVAAAHAARIDRAELRRRFPRRLLAERNGGVHYVTSVHAAPGGGSIAFVKGAPEQVLALCHSDLKGRLSRTGRQHILARNEALASAGLRVLGLAWGRLGARRAGTARRGYTFVALAGLRDPLRPGARDAVRAAARAGIRTVILTGDQHRTAESIARAVGLEGEVLDGVDAKRLLASSAAAARRRVLEAAAFARVAPADKLAIVHALRASGEIVAMAGDGVNDAPALKAADIGIAIGIGSSDLARQAADVVLEGEDLRSILSAVGEGRIVHDNLRRATRYLLATNLAEVLLVTGAALGGAREPFTPLQLLWINLLSDTFPALALALEPGRPDILDRPPRTPHASFLTERAKGEITRHGSLLAALGAGAFALGGRPLAFAALTGAELGYSFACRAPGTPPPQRFLRLVGGTALLQLAALTVPPLRVVLGMPMAPTLLELGGFGLSFALPVVLPNRPAAADPLIVRRGNAAGAITASSVVHSRRATRAGATHNRAASPVSRRRQDAERAQGGRRS